MNTMKIVMVTYSGDLTGKLGDLRRQLEARGAEVLRFDTDRFPNEAQVQFAQDGERETIRLRCDGQDVQLEPGDAIWYRRARRAANLPKTMDPPRRASSWTPPTAYASAATSRNSSGWPASSAWRPRAR